MIGSASILLGDCRVVMATMEAESVDAVVTDPPYGLSFMGKGWDHGVPGVPFWTEALRVLKPGGHLLAFGGTRTFHRLTCAIEDAGFEIRDCLSWLYGSGFPKSLDVSKAIDKAAGAEREVVGPNRFDGTNGKANATCYGEASRPPATVAATPAARAWSGWGTALKPAWEPIILARKPLGSTVAANVLKHGTGAINIAACRIAGAPRLTGTRNSDARAGSGNVYTGSDGAKQIAYDANPPSGRWPANVLLSHTPECREVGTRKVKVIGAPAHRMEHSTEGIAHSDVPHEHPGYRDPDGTETIPAWICSDSCPVRMLDEQSVAGGIHGAGSARPPGGDSEGGWGFIGKGDYGNARVGDSGGASRFFYTAKASRADREDGLGGMQPRSKANQYGDGLNTETKIRTVEQRERGTVERGSAANHHPTVKPTDLMRWLCKLITPRGGLILDPFCGSGSTGVAAVAEGFRFVGIEKESEYVDIARRRIANVAPLFNTEEE